MSGKSNPARCGGGSLPRTAPSHPNLSIHPASPVAANPVASPTLEGRGHAPGSQRCGDIHSDGTRTNPHPHLVCMYRRGHSSMISPDRFLPSTGPPQQLTGSASLGWIFCSWRWQVSCTPVGRHIPRTAYATRDDTFGHLPQYSVSYRSAVTRHRP
jgi:hypothetical protein